MPSTTEKPAVLYVSYDGMLEPLGAGQVLSYLEGLASSYRIHLISYEKPADLRDVSRLESAKHRIGSSGIEWHPLRYHKAPSALATSYDIARGVALAAFLVKRHGIRLVHARSDIPALIAMAMKRLSRAKFIFDIRGFWAEERVAAGLWPADGTLFSVATKCEKEFYLAADAVVSLTNSAANEIRSFPYLAGQVPPISVIPTCADLERFSIKESPPDGSTFVLGHVGSVTAWYDFDEVLRCFGALLEVHADSKLLIINRNQHDVIHERLAQHNIPEERVQVTGCEHADMPDWISKMSAGILIAKPSHAHMARSPTRLAEFLGSGRPFLSNDGIGDVTSILESEGVGIIHRDMSDEGRRLVMKELVTLAAKPGMAKRCAAAAGSRFSLADGVTAYSEIYASLLGRHDSAISSHGRA